MSRSGLGAAARRFASSLAQMLNRTVCDHAFVGVIERPDGKFAFGTELYSNNRARPVQMRTTGDVPCWLTVVGQVYLDEDGFLAVDKSSYQVSAGKPPVELFHYDYERDKPNHPDAHLQINVSGDAWDELLTASGRRKGTVGKLHLPVGGRRYRVSLEDVIEALVAEGILAPLPGWKDALDASRGEFRRTQLRAAVRRDPSTAAAELIRLGYDVRTPDQVGAPVIPLREQRRRFKRRR